MAYIVPIHRASGVRHALKLNLIDPEEESLVVVRSNRLEVYAQTPTGLVSRHSSAIHGQIVMLEKIRAESSLTDNLFIVTDAYKYFTLSWDATQGRLQTEREFVDVADKNARESHAYDRIFFDPRHQLLTMSLYEGICSILLAGTKATSKEGQGYLSDEILPVRVGEILLRSSTYFHYRTNNAKELPRLASLYEDNTGCAVLKVRNLQLSKKGDYIESTNEKLLLRDRLDPTASHLLPVPNPVNGLLILSETCITWVNDENEICKVEPLAAATIWSCWTQVDDNRWLLADDYGGLYFLMIDYNSELMELNGFQLDKLGTASRASTLVYLDGGCVFIGSHSGDSQVIQIVGQGEIQVVQTFPNIGPVLDFTIMDMGNRGGEGQVNEYSSGQARIVTGSGAFSDGSLRSIRSGVGVEEIGSIELSPSGTGASRAPTNMFHLPFSTEEGLNDFLLVSYVDETRVFNFDGDGSVEEIQQMITNEPTVLAEKLKGTRTRFIQITSRSVVIFVSNQGHLSVAAYWQLLDNNNVVSASVSDQHAVLSLGGTELVALDISESGTAQGQVTEVSRRKFDQLISCINIPNVYSNFLLVGFWQSTSLSILSAPDLNPVHATQISDDPSAVPRSVLLTQVLPNHPPTLFLSLADGHVVTFDVDKTNFTLSNRQTTILGSQQANLKILPRSEELFSIFAIAEHSTLIYGSDNRIVYSAVTADEATCICPFNSSAYPEAVALATPSEIKIAMVERERTTHVDTLPVGETVRRIAYSSELRAFGMGTIHRKLSEGAEILHSYFKLADEIAFDVLSSHELNEDEIVESVHRMHVDEDGERVERFVVGTSYLAEEEDVEHPRGRILVFQVTQDRVLKLVTETKVKGACRTLSSIDGKIVAGLVKTLVIFAYEFSGLQKKASYRCATAPIDLYTQDDMIVVSDIMKSVAVLKYTRGPYGEQDRLEELGRHFQLCWSTAIAPVGDGKVLEGDAEGNLLVLEQNKDGATEEDRRRLETISEMNLGEMVNRMRPIDIPASNNAIVVPRAFLGTVNGGIYMYGQIRTDLQNSLMELQAQIAEHVETPGKIPWASWRACRNMVRQESEPLRFVDGDLVEVFLDLPPDTQEEIVQKLGTNVPEVRNMVQSLRRMH